MDKLKESAARILHNNPGLLPHEVAHLKDVYEGRASNLIFRCKFTNGERYGLQVGR